MAFVAGITSGARAIDNTGQRITLPGGIGEFVRVTAIGANKVCVLAGDGTQLAAMPTDNATPNGKGTVIANGTTSDLIRLPTGAVDLHAICAAAETCTIYVTRVQAIPGI